MKKLDLTNLNNSDIKYKITSYPDGQQDVIINFFKDKEEVLKKIQWIDNRELVQINSRFNSFRDLELIICTTKALRRLGFKQIYLYIPYLLGSRSDRQFQEGGTSYLVDVIAPIINSLNFEGISVLDVHSDVAAACINGLGIVDNTKFVKDVLGEDKFEYGKFVLISPDAGALKKIYNIVKAIDYKGEVIVASKHRDLEGKITHTEVPFKNEYINKDMIIIDDICDGGRTFIEIVKALNRHMIGKKYLIITHGIFSAGLKDLSEYFDHIYTTNSIMDVHQDTEFWVRNDKYLNKVTQLNVF